MWLFPVNTTEDQNPDGITPDPENDLRSEVTTELLDNLSAIGQEAEAALIAYAKFLLSTGLIALTTKQIFDKTQEFVKKNCALQADVCGETNSMEIDTSQYFIGLLIFMLFVTFTTAIYSQINEHNADDQQQRNRTP